MNEDFTLEGMLNSFLAYKLESMFFCQPAIVVGVQHLDQQRIDVQPCINRLDADGYSVEYPAILSVPLQFPSSSTSAVTFPVNQGDTVLLVFSQRGMDVFKGGDGTASDPTDYRVFDKRDAIAIPSIFPFQKSINKQTNRTLPHDVNDMVVSHNIGTESECEVRMKPDGSIGITSPTIVNVVAKETIITTEQASVTATQAILTVPTLSLIGNTTILGNVALTGTFSVAGASTFVGLTTINGTPY